MILLVLTCRSQSEFNFRSSGRALCWRCPWAGRRSCSCSNIWIWFPRSFTLWWVHFVTFFLTSQIDHTFFCHHKNSLDHVVTHQPNIQILRPGFVGSFLFPRQKYKRILILQFSIVSIPYGTPICPHEFWTPQLLFFNPWFYFKLFKSAYNVTEYKPWFVAWGGSQFDSSSTINQKLPHPNLQINNL